jgi:hypothetical protein
VSPIRTTVSRSVPRAGEPAVSDQRSRQPAQDPEPPARGRYLTLQQAAEAFPAFSPRLLRGLVQERRIPFSRAGRCIVIAEADIHAYLERNRVEPPRWNVAL